MIKMDEQQRVFGQFWGVEPMPDSVPVRTAGVNKNDVLARKLTFMPETLFFTSSPGICYNLKNGYVVFMQAACTQEIKLKIR